MTPVREERIPSGVIDELLACCIFLSFGYTNIRARVDNVISATDSTIQRGGACRAVVPAKTAHALFPERRNEGRTRYVALV